MIYAAWIYLEEAIKSALPYHDVHAATIPEGVGINLIHEAVFGHLQVGATWTDEILHRLRSDLHVMNGKYKWNGGRLGGNDRVSTRAWARMGMAIMEDETIAFVGRMSVDGIKVSAAQVKKFLGVANEGPAPELLDRLYKDGKILSRSHIIRSEKREDRYESKR